MQKKLKSIGITSPKQLARITGKTYDMAYKVWNGKTNLSVAMAKKIKTRTGTSLDFLLS